MSPTFHQVLLCALLLATAGTTAEARSSGSWRKQRFGTLAAAGPWNKMRSMGRKANSELESDGPPALAAPGANTKGGSSIVDADDDRAAAVAIGDDKMDGKASKTGGKAESTVESAAVDADYEVEEGSAGRLGLRGGNPKALLLVLTKVAVTAGTAAYLWQTASGVIARIRSRREARLNNATGSAAVTQTTVNANGADNGDNIVAQPAAAASRPGFFGRLFGRHRRSAEDDMSPASRKVADRAEAEKRRILGYHGMVDEFQEKQQELAADMVGRQREEAAEMLEGTEA